MSDEFRLRGGIGRRQLGGGRGSAGDPLTLAAAAAPGLPVEGRTPAEWARDLALGFSVLGIALIVYLLLQRRRPLSTSVKWANLLAVAVVPTFAVLLGTFTTYEVTKEVNFCGSCHPVMDPYINDLRDPESKTLAAVHYANRYIPELQCYGCHVDYGLHGTMKAKQNGAWHMVKHFTNTWRLPLRTYEPYTNRICFLCHFDSKRYDAVDVHGAMADDLTTDKTSCLECHGPAHPAQAEAEPEKKKT